ncbi:MAG: RecX family transcriptional regulator [Paludibacteraceae bacterium]|nr:RecX family transcriptional regulator [Paludibacteraceae bacterium]
MANHDLSKQEALDKAEAYCARAEHCAADVQRKLYEWDVSSAWFNEIESHLYDADFLNDTRFCHAYVHDKVAYQSWGRLKIQAGLQTLHLPSSAIREALDAIDEETYLSNLRSLIAQRHNDPEEKRLRFLLQRGFTYEEIQKCK